VNNPVHPQGLAKVITGLERVLREPYLLADDGRLGLLYNQASIDSRYRPSPDLIHHAFPGRLEALFGPQHGVAGTEQDNMIETSHSMHPRLGLPIFSLYSDSRKPTADMLEGLDTILVDLQDVGTRVYTFATTVLELMTVCAASGRKVKILDRPNPINGVDVEGNLLKPELASFVGPYPIPMRHGLTLGELMMLYNDIYGLGCPLEVIRMSGWRRQLYFEDTGLPWVMPSPNMPCVQTAVVYPGQVVFEGTTLSEGRGTTRPFEIFGAPYLEPDRLRNFIAAPAVAGAVLREVSFNPVFNKHGGRVCRGFQLHVVDRDAFRPYRASLAIVSALLRCHPESFGWSSPPYEYVTDRLPIDVITGDSRIRRDLESNRSVLDMEQEWQQELSQFKQLRSRFLLYRSH